MDETFPYGYCKINRETRCYVGTKSDISRAVYTHNSCACNEVIALKFRHQVWTPNFIAEISELEVHLDYLKKELGRVTPFELKSRMDVVNNYVGRWRSRYLRAKLSLDDRPLDHKDFINKMFIKSDKEDKEISSAPRAIQYRNARAALEMGRMTHSIESEIYKLEDKYGTRIFGKGCNLHVLADDFIKKIGLFHDPVFVMLDASKFDAHVSVQCLQMMRRFYKSLFARKHSSYVNFLYGKTVSNLGFTSHGVRYKTYGTRMSGDMDTGLGNCLIMYTMLCAYMLDVGIDKYVVSVNGDDSVVIIERSQLVKARNISCFLRFGFKMKFEVTDELQKMEFCQCRLVETEYGWVFSRDPRRILRRCGWSIENYTGKRLRDYVYTVGMGERAVNYGLPIGYPLAEALISLVPSGKLRALDRKQTLGFRGAKFWNNKDKAIISYETRNSYDRAWDISPEEQISIEENFDVSLKQPLTNEQLLAYESFVQVPPDMG